MQYLSRIQRGVDFVEDHLDAQFVLREVSAAAGLSHWHFQRTFKALTGETLAAYVRGRRMAKALNTLMEEDTRILDVAIAAGFDSQEAFTRAFKRTFEMTPGQVRALGKRAHRVKKLRLDAEYMRHIQDNVSLHPEVIDRPAMTLVGLHTLIYGVESEKNNIADKLPGLWDAFLERLGEIQSRTPGACYGVVRPAVEDPDRLEYFAVTEVTASDAVPEGMVTLTLPATRYAQFTHRGDPRLLDQTVSYIYSTWLTRADARPTYGADLEVYGADYVMDDDASVMHYAVPIMAG